MNHVLIVPLARTNGLIHVNASGVVPPGVVSRPPKCKVTVVPKGWTHNDVAPKKRWCREEIPDAKESTEGVTNQTAVLRRRCIQGIDEWDQLLLDEGSKVLSPPRRPLNVRSIGLRGHHSPIRDIGGR